MENKKIIGVIALLILMLVSCGYEETLDTEPLLTDRDVALDKEYEYDCNQLYDTLNEMVRELVEEYNSNNHRWFDLDIEIISNYEITLTYKFLDETDDLESGTELATNLINDNRELYQRHARLFRFHTSVDEFIVNVEYINSDNYVLASRTFIHPQEFTEDGILEDLAISFPDREFVIIGHVGAGVVAGYEIRCVETSVTFRTSNLYSLSALYMYALWNDFVDNWNFTFNAVVEEILTPIYRNEVNLDWLPTLINTRLTPSRKSESHFEAITQAREDVITFEDFVEGYRRFLLERGTGCQIMMSIGYVVYVSNFDIEYESNRLKAVVSELISLTSIPIDINVAFMPENSYMLYHFSLSTDSLAADDLDGYDLTQYFWENRYFHCDKCMTYRDRFCPREVEEYFENRDELEDNETQ